LGVRKTGIKEFKEKYRAGSMLEFEQQKPMNLSTKLVSLLRKLL
jgi:hypothetical protein